MLNLLETFLVIRSFVSKLIKILKEGLCLCDRCCMGVGSVLCTIVDVCVVQVLKRCRAEAVHVLRLCCAELDAITGRAELELGSYG